VIVHGGGPEMQRTFEKLGRRGELDRPSSRDLAVVEMVMTGRINTELVTLLNAGEGANAVGLSGKDAGLLRARKDGTITSVNKELLEMMLEKRYVPVVSPIGLGDDGQGHDLGADDVAAEIAIAIGAEKLIYLTDVAGILEAGELVDVEETRTVDVRGAAASGRSPFMDIYAEKTRAYMARSGATVDDFARVTVKSRLGGSMNPLAQFNEPTTVEAVLASRTIAAPLTLPMCSAVGDGAAAVVLGSEAFARRVVDGGPRVHVRASVLASNNRDGAAPVCARRAADRAYEHAGLGPGDIDVVELHDATAPAELFLYEHLRFCAPDGAPDLLRSGVTSPGGRMPVNPGGGLLSRGHPVGATGCAQLVELVDQVRAGGYCPMEVREGRPSGEGARVCNDVSGS